MAYTSQHLVGGFCRSSLISKASSHTSEITHPQNTGVINDTCLK